MSKLFAEVAAGAVFVIANISAAAASPAAAPMLEGGYALAPFSFVKFCIDYPGECPKEPGPARIRLTSGRMAELASVNSKVNDAIVPTPDTSALRYWKLNVDAGDCNAFAVQKRHELIQRGWPAAALALAVAKTSWGEGHLVVTVRTDRGDLVLDNLNANIVPWQKSGYHWIMRQSEGNPRYWVDLHGGKAGPLEANQSLDDKTAAAEAVIPLPPRDRPADAASPAGPRQPLPAKVAAAAIDAVGKGAQTSLVPLAPALDARATTLAIEAAEAREIGRFAADLALWAAQNGVEAAYEGIIAALEPLEGSSPVNPPVGIDLQANLAEPIDPTQFGFI
jgi:predicted transglutaminase-like cysteine proteinase